MSRLGRYRSEVNLKDAAQLGQTRYYSFAFNLKNAWEFDDTYMVCVLFLNQIYLYI